MREIGVVIIFLVSITELGFGQCPSVQINIQDTVCLNENVLISNNSDPNLTFKWDFLSGDFDNNFDVSDLGPDNRFKNSFSIDVVFDGVDWYGFTLNWSLKKIMRLDFGNDLNNSPTIVDIGNIDNLLSGPWVINIVKDGNNWHGFFVNGGNSKIYRLDFGTQLNNVSPILTEIAQGGNSNGNLKVVKEDNEYFLVLTEINTISIIRIGSNITNTPSVSDRITSSPISGANLLLGLSLIKNCENWYGLMSSLSTDKIFFLDFGNSIFNIPQVTDITNFFLGIDNPAELSLVREKDRFWAYVIARTGNLYRVDFGNDLENLVPNVQNLGNFGVMQTPSAFKMVDQNSEFYLFTINFGDGSITKLNIPQENDANTFVSEDFTPSSVSYNTKGLYYIEITTKDEFGAVNYSFDSVYVLPAAESNFSSVKKCVNEITEFQDLSVVEGKPIIDWQWDFGDPVSGADNTSILQNPTHAYASPGDYSVNLLVMDDCGQLSDTTITIKIVSENDLQPAFSITEPILCSNDSLQFTDLSIFTDDIPVTWLWNFGDPASSENTSTQQNPKHFYASPGDYNVELRVTGESGCEKTIVSNITVVAGPSVSYSFDNSCLNNSIAFNNNSLGTDIIGYTWDFGDGVTSNLVNPTHTFTNPGNYEVRLTVENAIGCNVTNTQTVTVYSLPEVAFINELACSDGTTKFFDQSTASNANITGWIWDFGDGNSSAEKDPIHIYQTSGSFLVSLTTTTNFGCTATLEKTVEVIVGPTVDFAINPGCLGEEMQFEDLSETTDGSAITSWFWEIEEQVFTEQNPSTTFNLPGTYEVSLTVTSSTFCSATTTKDLVINPLPLANFVVDNPCVNDVVQFTDASIVSNDPIVTYSWDFENLDSSSEVNPVFTFENTGDYNVALTISTAAGCVSTISKIISILDRPEGAFSIDVSQGPPPLIVNFLNGSSGAESFNWDFGNGERSTVTNPIFTFTDLGLYEVTMVASTDAGCTDTVKQRVNVVEPIVDVAIEGMTTLSQGDKTFVSIEIRNNGTLFLDKVEVALEIGSEVSVTETIDQIIAPGELVVYPLNISITNRNTTPYICANLTPFGTNITEQIITNNTFCTNLNEKSNVIKPFPNPSNHLVTLGVVLQESQKVSLAMHNGFGQPVFEKEYGNLHEGLNEFQIDVTGVSDGVYWLKLQFGSNEEVFKVFVNK